MTWSDGHPAASGVPRLPEARQPGLGDGDGSGAAAPQESVCVAVNIRPLIEPELIEGCKPALLVTPGEPQVGRSTGGHACDVPVAGWRSLGERVCSAPRIPGLEWGSWRMQVFAGSHGPYTFDHIFGEGAEPASALYDCCVAPLVDGLFKGYNGGAPHDHMPSQLVDGTALRHWGLCCAVLTAARQTDCHLAVRAPPPPRFPQPLCLPTARPAAARRACRPCCSAFLVAERGS
jgi:hypothetical protein